MTTPEPTTTNGTATAVNTAIAAAFSAGEVDVEALIIADAPWLGLPGLKQILDAIIGYVGGKFSKVFQNAGTFTVIDAQVDHEESNLSQALKNVIQAEKGGDPHAIQEAIQAYAAAQSALVNDDGGAPAQ